MASMALFTVEDLKNTGNEPCIKTIAIYNAK